MIDSSKAPQTTSASVQGKLVCEHCGNNMHVEGKGSNRVQAVCYTQSCTIYRIQYDVVFPTAVLNKKEIQTNEGVK